MGMPVVLLSYVHRSISNENLLFRHRNRIFALF